MSITGDIDDVLLDFFRSHELERQEIDVITQYRQSEENHIDLQNF